MLAVDSIRFHVWCTTSTNVHPDQINFVHRFAIVNMSTRRCSRQRINKESHLGGCGNCYNHNNFKFFPFSSPWKNDKRMAQISFCQQQLAHNLITLACLSLAIQTSHTFSEQGGNHFGSWFIISATFITTREPWSSTKCSKTFEQLVAVTNISVNSKAWTCSSFSLSLLFNMNRK